jgi:hypothetical protein
MVDVNETLENMNFEKYKSYNNFCIDIEKSIIKTFGNSDIELLTPKIIVISLNNMIKYKILKDNNYEKKIKNYFNDSDNILNEINKLKEEKK